MHRYSQSTFNVVRVNKELEPSRLWFEVIMQGFRDILNGNVEAREWLYSDDFGTCCERAGARNMQDIRQLIEQALRTPVSATQKKVA